MLSLTVKASACSENIVFLNYVVDCLCTKLDYIASIVLQKYKLSMHYLACVAGVRKGRGRELGREIAREGVGRRGTPARKPLFSPSRLLINKNNATVND